MTTPLPNPVRAPKRALVVALTIVGSVIVSLAILEVLRARYGFDPVARLVALVPATPTTPTQSAGA